MTTPTLSPEQEALARKGLHYAQAITDLARELELPPEFVLTVFGMFAKKMIDPDKPEEVQWAVSAFMHGMGFALEGAVPAGRPH